MQQKEFIQRWMSGVPFRRYQVWGRFHPSAPFKFITERDSLYAARRHARNHERYAGYIETQICPITYG